MPPYLPSWVNVILISDGAISQVEVKHTLTIVRENLGDELTFLICLNTWRPAAQSKNSSFATHPLSQLLIRASHIPHIWYNNTPRSNSNRTIMAKRKRAARSKPKQETEA
jgi:hypothetical protein